MNYLSSKELSEKWGITPGRIIKLAREGRISGAKLYGKTWVFPENAAKPIDARTKNGKCVKAQETDTYRYPCFEYQDAATFNPPLNEEENLLKTVTETYYACRFEEADQLLGNLAETTTDKYRRICAIYTGCMLDMMLCRPEQYFCRYDKLMTECRGDYPHQAEMNQYLYQLNAILGNNSYYGETFKIQSNDAYHESFFSRLANLAAVSLAFAEIQPSIQELTAHEVNCLMLEKHGVPTDAQALHLSLGIIYGIKGMTEEMTCHLKKALNLAQKHDMFFNLVNHYHQFFHFFNPVLTEFPESFRNRVIDLSKEVRQRFVQFSNSLAYNHIYTLMASKDYLYLHYTIMGLNNKAIAKRLHLSEPTVSKRFSSIYADLGIKTKAELKKLYHQSVHNATPGNCPPQ